MTETTGSVAGFDPTVRIVLHGPRGAETVPAVVDTGMQSALQLPVPLFERHRRGRPSDGSTRLADGRVVPQREAVVEVELCGARTRVLAEEMGDHVLIGMTLLAGCRLTVDCREGGPVTITPLAQSSPNAP